MEFSSNLSAIYTKWCAQTFPPLFGLFVTFDGNFAKIVALPSDENENYVVHLKVPSEINAENIVKPLTNSALASERYTFSHLQPARVVRSSPNFACW